MSKKTAKKKVNVTFEVRLISEGLSPARVPLRAVSDALAAVQDLASGRDPYESQSVPQESAIGLVDVRGGSAVYQCVSRAPEDAIANLSRVGEILAASENGNKPVDDQSDEIIALLKPIESLSKVAKTLGCRVEIRLNRRTPLFEIDEGKYNRISQRFLIEGETSVTGTIQRVGGATGNRCLLRIPDRKRILYCDVEGRKLARKLGQHLYEPIVAKGTATWLHSTWRIHKFKIKSFSQPRIGNVDDAIAALRKAGLDAWDDIDNPEEYLKEFQS